MSRRQTQIFIFIIPSILEIQKRTRNCNHLLGDRSTWPKTLACGFYSQSLQVHRSHSRALFHILKIQWKSHRIENTRVLAVLLLFRADRYQRLISTWFFIVINCYRLCSCPGQSSAASRTRAEMIKSIRGNCKNERNKVYDSCKIGTSLRM
jgi:hypothetical protein